MTGMDATLIHRLAATLTRTQRLIVSLYYCEELTPREIAGVLELPEQTVHRALNQITTHARRFIAEQSMTTLAAVA